MGIGAGEAYQGVFLGELSPRNLPGPIVVRRRGHGATFSSEYREGRDSYPGWDPAEILDLAERIAK